MLVDDSGGFGGLAAALLEEVRCSSAMQLPDLACVHTLSHEHAVTRSPAASRGPALSMWSSHYMPAQVHQEYGAGRPVALFSVRPQRPALAAAAANQRARCVVLPVCLIPALGTVCYMLVLDISAYLDQCDAWSPLNIAVMLLPLHTVGSVCDHCISDIPHSRALHHQQEQFPP